MLDTRRGDFHDAAQDYRECMDYYAEHSELHPRRVEQDDDELFARALKAVTLLRTAA